MPASGENAAKKKMGRVRRVQARRIRRVRPVRERAIGISLCPRPWPAQAWLRLRRRVPIFTLVPSSSPYAPVVITSVGGGDALGDLDIFAISNAERRRLAMGGAVGADDHDGLGAVLRGSTARAGIFERLSHGAAGDGDLDRSADFERAFLVVGFEPDFDGGAAGSSAGLMRETLAATGSAMPGT